MTEQRQNSKELSVSNKSMNDGMEVDWANIFREIISIRKTLYKAARNRPNCRNCCGSEHS